MGDVGQNIVGKLPGLKQFKSWVYESESAHSAWRKESWTDARFRDGAQWSNAERQALIDKDINPLTINRIFPVINLITGNFANNQHDIVAVGRTQEDADISQTASEGIAYVMDQYGGYDLIYNAFNDQVVPGFGALGVCLNPDPRKEKVQVKEYPWYSIWWDPYSDPWMNPAKCRYVYYADWKDLDDVAALYPEKASILRDHYAELSTENRSSGWEDDQGTMVEDKRSESIHSGHWVQKGRNRIRPVELWYTVKARTWFADFGNGELKEMDGKSAAEQFSMVEAANQCFCADVTKIRVATFVGDVLLSDQASPYPHNQFPFVPFVGYLDSYGLPYGVPRQVREMNMEVNKRRSMALSLISNRRVIMEKGTAEDKHAVYEEANRQDGLIILNDGKSESFQIQEMQSLAAPQIDLLHQSEREIQEITGANDDALGYTSGSESAVLTENRQQRAGMMTASLLKNLKRSQKILGSQIMSNIQNTWTGPKVLRVTDRASGVESFAHLNDPHFNPATGRIEIRNNIVAGKYDIIISEKPMTDTIREKNLENIFTAIQKAPPEAIAPLLSLAFELSNLPNKEQLLQQVRMSLGVEPIDPLLTGAEAKQKAMDKQQQMDEQQAADSDMEMQERQAEIEKTRAEIDKLIAEAQAEKVNAETDRQKLALEAEKIRVEEAASRRDDYEAGMKLRFELEKNRAESKKPAKESAK